MKPMTRIAALRALVSILLTAAASPVPAEEAPAPDPFAPVVERGAVDWSSLAATPRWWMHADLISGVLTLKDVQPGAERLVANVELEVQDPSSGQVRSRHAGTFDAVAGEDGIAVTLSLPTSPHDRPLSATGRLGLNRANMGGVTTWEGDPVRRGVWLATRMDGDRVDAGLAYELTGARTRRVVAIIEWSRLAPRYFDGVRVDVRRRRADGQERIASSTIPAALLADRNYQVELSYPLEPADEPAHLFQYEYRSAFLLRDGAVIESPWKAGDWAGVTVGWPYTDRTLALEGDFSARPDVRGVTASVFTRVGSVELEATEVIEVAPSGRVDAKLMVARPQGERFDYEITWRLADGSTVRSGRQSGDGDILFLDELPGPAVSAP